MRIPGRIFLAILFAAALPDPGAAHAEKPVPKSWAEFMSKATAYLSSQQDAAKREFALESWERYDLDPKTGTFKFSTKGKPGDETDGWRNWEPRSSSSPRPSRPA